MGFIKKIDVYVLKKFLLLFAGSFLVCLFVLIMQFLWRYVEELIGKGLSIDVLIKFFWYASITLVPSALPLAILLASLIMFGNMGEQLELTAMKSAGIPLRRIMVPVGVLSIALGITSFFFQNDVSPKAQKELYRLIATMKQTSPAIEIPEGMFYSGIPNVNIYVDHKNAKTGMLYKVIIYKMDQGFQNAQIVVADSARLETTADKHFLSLDIYNGEEFENMQTNSSSLLKQTQVPYDRETFKEKKLLINFDSDFSLMDADLFSGMARVKNLEELDRGADSIFKTCDSIGSSYYTALYARYLQTGYMSNADTTLARKLATKPASHPDSIFERLSAEKKLSAIEEAQMTVRNAITELEWEKVTTADGYKNARKHLISWHEKFALSLGCIIFFFIGAPLGAIIRKGGLGLPTVVSVLFFILYYIINTAGMKLGRDGTWNVTFGMWLSTMVLAPLGAFLSHKANNDSVVFNIDSYITLIRRFFGFKTSRYFLPKEVVIDNPDYQHEAESLVQLTKHCQDYIKEHHLPHARNYIKLFFKDVQKDNIKQLQEELEEIIEHLSNSRDLYLLDALGKYPFLHTNSYTMFKQRGINIALGILLPVGIFFWFRVWRFRILLFRDLKIVIKQNEHTRQLVLKLAAEEQSQH